MSASMRIVNGQVYDPKNNIDGEVKEICVEDGQPVEFGQKLLILE